MLRHIDPSHTTHYEVFLFPSIPQWLLSRLWTICYRSIQSFSSIRDRYVEILRLHPFFVSLSILEYLQSTGILRGWPTLVLLLLYPSEEVAWTLRHISPQCRFDCGFLLRDCNSICWLWLHLRTAALFRDYSSMCWLWLHLRTVAFMTGAPRVDCGCTSGLWPSWLQHHMLIVATP